MLEVVIMSAVPHEEAHGQMSLNDAIESGKRVASQRVRKRWPGRGSF